MLWSLSFFFFFLLWSIVSCFKKSHNEAFKVHRNSYLNHLLPPPENPLLSPRRRSLPPSPQAVSKACDLAPITAQSMLCPLLQSLDKFILFSLPLTLYLGLVYMLHAAADLQNNHFTWMLIDEEQDYSQTAFNCLINARNEVPVWLDKGVCKLVGVLFYKFWVNSHPCAFLWHQNAIVYFQELPCQGLMTHSLRLLPFPSTPHTSNLCSGSYSPSSLGPTMLG